MTHTLLARVHTFSEKCDSYILRKHAGIRKNRQKRKNAFKGLVASYIGPYTLHEAVYSAEITAMVLLAGLPIDISSNHPVSISAKGRLCMLPHLKLV